jgi:replicative DNA helicase
VNKNKGIDLGKLYSLEAEAGVLGSIIIDPVSITRVLPILPCTEMFFEPKHQIIYEALIKLYVANTPIDAIALRTELKEQNKLKEAGGVEYIAKILKSVPHSANAAYYAGIVRDKEKERQMINAVTEINEIIEQPGTVNERIQLIQNRVLELEPADTTNNYVEIKKHSTDVAVEMRDNKGESVQTGFGDLDWMIHGYYPGEYVILAGRPSMGKSALALTMALQMSKAGTPVFFSSLEMTARSMIERAICSLACVDMARLRSEEEDERDWSKVYEQGFALQALDIIFSTIAYTPEQFAGIVHRLKQTHKIGIAFVDYLQLMRTRKHTENRQQEITNISQALKRIALRENIPIVALSQLNRQVDNRENHRPRLSDLRESGSLEQDADLVQFVYRDDYYRKDEPGFKPTGIAEIITAKNRRGRTGTTKLVFIHDYAKFSNLSKGW